MNTTEPQHKSIAELSVDTQVLMDRLKKVKPDEVITYKELSEAIKRNVQADARYLLESARRKLINDENILFDAVFGEGLKRIHGEQIIAVGDRGVRLIGKHARRVARKINCIGDEYHGLTDEQKHRYNGVGAILAVVGHTTKEAQIQSVSDAAGEKLSLNKTLEMFSKK